MNARETLRRKLSDDVLLFIAKGGRIDRANILIRTINESLPPIRRIQYANPFNKKLTAEHAREIRRSTLPATTVAKQYGVTPDYVRKIRKHERWSATE